MAAAVDFDEAKWFLYRRDEVKAAIAAGKPIILVEGEKDVETLREWGLVATTNQGGAKNWHPELNADLKGADVVICSDIDEAGNARTMLRGADLLGVAKSVRVLDLALHWTDAPDKADVSDWKENAGGTAEKFVALIKKAPAWHPERPRAFGAYYHDEIDGPGLEYDYLIDGLLTARGRSVIGGHRVPGNPSSPCTPRIASPEGKSSSVITSSRVGSSTRPGRAVSA